MPITLSDDVTRQSIASIRRFCAEELDLDIGDLKAGTVLEFFLKELAPSVYNAAIGDAQGFLRDRVADLDAACTAPEFAYWERAAVRRGRAR